MIKKTLIILVGIIAIFSLTFIKTDKTYFTHFGALISKKANSGKAQSRQHNLNLQKHRPNFRADPTR